MENILVIGIAGGSGSGKTTLMKNLIGRFGDVVTVLSHDNYYLPHDDLPYEERCKLNYDEPAAFETDLMVRQLEQLRRGAHRLPGVQLHRPQPQQRDHPGGAPPGHHRGGYPDL